MRAIRSDASHDGRAADREGVMMQPGWSHPAAWAPFTPKLVNNRVSAMGRFPTFDG